MVPALTGHHHDVENKGNGYIKILDIGSKPLFTVTGLISRYQPGILHPAHSYGRYYTTCISSPGLVLEQSRDIEKTFLSVRKKLNMGCFLPI